MVYLHTFTYHKNQPNAGKYTSPMDLMGIDAVFPAKESGANQVRSVVYPMIFTRFDTSPM